MGHPSSKKEKSPENSTPVSVVEESLPLTVTDTQSAARNYVDCTESNGEEEDDDDEEGEEHDRKGDTKPTKEVIKEGERSKEPDENKMEEERKETSNAPKWEDFFNREMLSDSQNSQSQSCCSNTTTSPSRMTDSQTPELFSDQEEETHEKNDGFSFGPSSAASNNSSQNMILLLTPLILQPEQGGREQGDASSNTKKESDDLIVPSELEELSASQASQTSRASSDCDIACTPESKVPRPDELSQLYRKLGASGGGKWSSEREVRLLWI
ncbi:protein artemis-like protein [Lates japonicus]|uniref:Protein artemis-like protein n=1 Tax=Lates japonicus TaxID=270547 RepID=A0AAD3QVY8_LATJO|nr:protein artemis-like protein [Lates japonicus]